MTETKIGTASTACDCGDCEFVGTDCCVDRPDCEVVRGGNSAVSDDEGITVCAEGFGCAGDRVGYLVTEAEGLDLLAREEADIGL